MNNRQPIETARNADLRGSLPALQRAAERARELAAQTGTALVVVRDGTVRHVYPQLAALPQRAQEDAPTYGKPG